MVYLKLHMLCREAHKEKAMFSGILFEDADIVDILQAWTRLSNHEHLVGADVTRYHVGFGRLRH